MLICASSEIGEPILLLILMGILMPIMVIHGGKLMKLEMSTIATTLSVMLNSPFKLPTGWRHPTHLVFREMITAINQQEPVLYLMHMHKQIPGRQVRLHPR